MTVITTSRVSIGLPLESFFVGCGPTGMPRPLSSTHTVLSAWIVTFIVSHAPARASSIELSTTSYTRWCRALMSVPPTYMPGRFRTCSIPSSAWIDSTPYSAEVLLLAIHESPEIDGGRPTTDGCRPRCIVYRLSTVVLFWVISHCRISFHQRRRSL